jgi:hypothetical protein
MGERREMVRGVSTLGVFFDIDRLTQKYDTGSYGFPGWKIIWGAIDIQKLTRPICLMVIQTEPLIATKGCGVLHFNQIIGIAYLTFNHPLRIIQISKPLQQQPCLRKTTPSLQNRCQDRAESKRPSRWANT